MIERANPKEVFELCSYFRKEVIDFDDLYRDETNPFKDDGYHKVYPKLISSKKGSSFTYQISRDKFFKRRLQDGQNPHTVLSQHHHKIMDNELFGSFDDLGEVISYHLSRTIIDPLTGKPIVKIPEYKLATYMDESGYVLRGCTSKNVCENEGQRLISMAEIMKDVGSPEGKSIDVYMAALEKYVKSRGIECDLPQVRRCMLRDSMYNWKTANSDNHKNNVVLIEERLSNGKKRIYSEWIIDNGSTYELSSNYVNTDGELRFASLYGDNESSRVDENGNRVLAFSHYPYMHAAFQLETDRLLIPSTKIGDKTYNYEYGLASEMLEDNELFRQVYEIDRQFSLDRAIAEIDSIYGAGKPGEKQLNWPPHLKEFMYATDEIKKKVLSYVVADYYLKVAFDAMIGKFDSEKHFELFLAFKEDMMRVPLLDSKEAYEKLFVAIAKKHGIEIDVSKLKTLKFKAEEEPASAKQPNE